MSCLNDNDAADDDVMTQDYLSQPVNIVRKSASSQYVSSSLPMMSLSTTQFCYFPYAVCISLTRYQLSYTIDTATVFGEAKNTTRINDGCSTLLSNITTHAEMEKRTNM